jgi:integrative and conjugative element protein (TIGR02256 family)
VTIWRGRTPDGCYRVAIEATALRTLARLCREAGQKETGGILIGEYSADLLWAIVREATPPPSDSLRGTYRFVRGIAGLAEMLRRRWHSRKRRHYLGEWHFHPSIVVEPSAEDFEQMARIAETDSYECRDPILVIIGKAKRAGSRPLRAFVCPRGAPAIEMVAEAETSVHEPIGDTVRRSSS